MHFYPRMPRSEKPTEPTAGRPAGSAEEWLGRNRDEKRRLWERLSPRHRKTLQLLAGALVAQQSQARLEETTRAKLHQLLTDLERLANRATTLLVEVARRTRPRS